MIYSRSEATGEEGAGAGAATVAVAVGAIIPAGIAM